MSSVLLWKQEPASPLSECDEAALLDATIYNATPFEAIDIKFDVDANLDDIANFESKAEVASHLLENLENLMDLDELIKDEPFLLDEKILPMFEDVDSARAVPVSVTELKSEYANNNTQYLLKEFETVYDAVEFTHDTLTPPQSPPSQQPLLTTLEPLLQYPAIVPTIKPVYTPQQNYAITEQIQYGSVNPDIAHALAEVDELVRTRVEDMQGSSSSSSSIGSSSDCGGPLSPGSTSEDCSSDDPEWVPETIEEFGAPAIKQSRKRSRPSTKSTKTNVEDKKVRKKEQNKNAATRYRMKKKAECMEILLIEQGMADKNNQLTNQITDLHREIKYLKGLMRDLFKAKGLIN
ncbi:unnamed protein product [Phyllotreta striolata]|uniref:BZIP domain-containing protein n=1 Tax=Phyllotreta striolata TaxID=444603 RepID=A0A9N9XQJ4_PHYSR|nr:unnamed protein product [Phyllotreta striolata]